MTLSTTDVGSHTTRCRKKENPNNVSSPLEKCSFAFHLILFPVGVAYLLWVMAPKEWIETSMGVSYYLKKDYAFYFPVTALFLFFAIPLIYAALNSFTVPQLSSTDTIQDIYTRSSTIPHPSSKNLSTPESTLPEICDLDPTKLVWYHPTQ